jgi:DNA-binding response OmpR family regulator
MQGYTDTVTNKVWPPAVSGRGIGHLWQVKRDDDHFPTCLVIDDNQVIRQYVAAMLIRLGYQVDTAENKLDVLSKLTTCPYDLVVTDLEMPDMNGFHLAVTVKTESQATKVIIMTGRYAGDCMEMMDTGWADGWIFKPFGMDDLRSKLEALAAV